MDDLPLFSESCHSRASDKSRATISTAARGHRAGTGSWCTLPSPGTVSIGISTPRTGSWSRATRSANAGRGRAHPGQREGEPDGAAGLRHLSGDSGVALENVQVARDRAAPRYAAVQEVHLQPIGQIDERGSAAFLESPKRARRSRLAQTIQYDQKRASVRHERAAKRSTTGNTCRASCHARRQRRGEQRRHGLLQWGFPCA